MRGTWTEEEDSVLREPKPLLWKAHQLGRTRSAVAYRSRQLGITQPLLYSRRPMEPQFQNPAEWAYFAGLIDGEGWISIGAHRPNRKGPFLRPYFAIVNTDRKMLEWVARKTTLKVHMENRRVGGRWSPTLGRIIEKRLPAYSVQGLGYKILPILDGLIPYLITKKDRAELVAKWIRLRLPKPPQSHYTEEEVKLALRVRRLNGKSRSTGIPYQKSVATLKDLLHRSRQISAPTLPTTS